MKNQFDFYQVTEENADIYRDGFIACYKEAFGGAPYFEIYTDQQVNDEVYMFHLKEGIVVIASDNNHLVGLSCALPYVHGQEENKIFLEACAKSGELPLDPSKMWYMSEVGVRTSHRSKGIGSELTRIRLHRLSELGHNHYYMRTAAHGSKSIGIYRRAGAIQLPGHIDVSETNQVQENASKSNLRIVLYGDCATSAKLLA